MATGRYLLLGETESRHSTSKWTRERISGLAGRDLADWADWVDLIESGEGGERRPWNVRDASSRAAALAPTFGEYRGVICLGRRVSGIVIPGGGGFPFFRWTLPRGSSTEVCVIPHPSGVVRFWNDPENVEKAELFLSALPERV